MPVPPNTQLVESSRSAELEATSRQLHWDGWSRLPDSCIPDLRSWEPCAFVERLHRRYHDRIVRFLEERRDEWMKEDEEGSAPGCDRPGGWVAHLVTDDLEGSGVFVYAAHPSQADDAEEYDYSGPRWYVTVTEALLKHYRRCKVAPPPPPDIQSILWPNDSDQNRPWLTEIGWTIVPENSDPQVMHADICCADAPCPRKPGHGRYHHLGWKMEEGQTCTTNVVTGAFTEGRAKWEHYEKERWTTVQVPCLIFDSEMLHRGGQSKPGAGWTSTLTVQVCSGSGYSALWERVSDAMMWYTQPLGWTVGDAVEAFARRRWHRAVVVARDKHGRYSVQLEGNGTIHDQLLDSQLRYRTTLSQCNVRHDFPVGTFVDVYYEGAWQPAKVAKCNLDGSYRVVWKQDRSFTDALEGASLRASLLFSDAESSERPKPKFRRARDEIESSSSDEQSDERTHKIKKRKLSAKALSVTEMTSALFKDGYVELHGGLPLSWRWALLDFVETCHDKFSKCIIRELESLREFWKPVDGSQERYGAFAAAKVSDRLKAYGIAVYTPGSSQDQKSPYMPSGPRWYVSVTAAALKHFGVAPPAPEELLEMLCSHPTDSEGDLRARGLGWALAPAGSDPQAVHADIWGHSGHARSDRCRWPHILWKRRRSDFCTTQLVPGGFTEGAVRACHFNQLQQVRAPAIVVDSECLHRGAATPPMPVGAKPPEGWVSSLSLELCTASGWAAWEAFETGGTENDPSSPLDWRMLRIARPGQANKPAAKPFFSGDTSAVKLEPAPWHTAHGRRMLRHEKQEWELSTFYNFC